MHPFSSQKVYCEFTPEDVDAIIDALDEELQEVSAKAVILEDELELLDGRGQTTSLKKVCEKSSTKLSQRGEWKKGRERGVVAQCRGNPALNRHEA